MFSLILGADGMTAIENISEKVKVLFEKYEFNVNAIAKYSK